MLTPYAQFRHSGVVLTLSREQFAKGFALGVVCQCDQCLSCRIVDYWRENRPNDTTPTTKLADNV